MTQITTTTQPGDIVVIVPGWIIRAVGFLGLFCGLTLSFLVFAAGYVIEGLLSAVLMLGIVPIWMLFQYIFWRFHWYLLLIAMILSATLCGSSLLLGMRVTPSIAQSQFGSTAANFLTISPANGLVAFVIALLVTGVLYRFYTLWRSGAQAKPQAQPSNNDLFDFETPAPTVDSSLMSRVLKKLEATGSRVEIRGDTIHVYKGGRFIGIVRVIDRGGAISPVILNDVIKQRDRLGAKVAYLATSGMFTGQVRDMADQQGVKLMVV